MTFYAGLALSMASEQFDLVAAHLDIPRDEWLRLL